MCGITKNVHTNRLKSQISNSHMHQLTNRWHHLATSDFYKIAFQYSVNKYVLIFCVYYCQSSLLPRHSSCVGPHWDGVGGLWSQVSQLYRGGCDIHHSPTFLSSEGHDIKHYYTTQYTHSLFIDSVVVSGVTVGMVAAGSVWKGMPQVKTYTEFV